jgi:hypothetical protein
VAAAQHGAVPTVLVWDSFWDSFWDSEAGIGRWRAGQPELTKAGQGFRGTLGQAVLVYEPRDPWARRLVEGFHDELERSLLPGRTFTGPWFAPLRPHSSRLVPAVRQVVRGGRPSQTAR